MFVYMAIMKRLTSFLVCLADIARQICTNLGADAHAVADFNRCHFGTCFHDFSNNLVPDAKWHWSFAPSAVDLVNIATAHSTSVNCDVDVKIFKSLQLELERL